MVILFLKMMADPQEENRGGLKIMRKQKRSGWLFLIVALLTLSLISCGNQEVQELKAQVSELTGEKESAIWERDQAEEILAQYEAKIKEISKLMVEVSYPLENEKYQKKLTETEKKKYMSQRIVESSGLEGKSTEQQLEEIQTWVEEKGNNFWNVSADFEWWLKVAKTQEESNAKQASEIASLREDLKKAQKDYDAFQKEEQGLKQELEQAEQSLTKEKREAERLQGEVYRIKSAKLGLDQDIAKAKTDLSEAKEELKKLKIDLVKESARLQTALEEKGQLEEQMAAAEAVDEGLKITEKEIGEAYDKAMEQFGMTTAEKEVSVAQLNVSLAQFDFFIYSACLALTPPQKREMVGKDIILVATKFVLDFAATSDNEQRFTLATEFMNAFPMRNNVEVFRVVKGHWQRWESTNKRFVQARLHLEELIAQQQSPDSVEPPIETVIAQTRVSSRPGARPDKQLETRRWSNNPYAIENLGD